MISAALPKWNQHMPSRRRHMPAVLAIATHGPAKYKFQQPARATDRFTSYWHKDFRLGLKAAQTTLAAIANLPARRSGNEARQRVSRNKQKRISPSVLAATQ
jgi:hypothetical protein